MDTVDSIPEQPGRPRVRVHLAGVVHEEKQRCVRCGLRLPHASDPVGWEVGSFVRISVRGSGVTDYWIGPVQLEGNEVNCDLFERN